MLPADPAARNISRWNCSSTKRTSNSHTSPTKGGRQTPGLAQLKGALEDLRGLLDSLLHDKRKAEPVMGPPDGPGSQEIGPELRASQEGANVPGAAGPVRNRQDALNRLV